MRGVPAWRAALRPAPLIRPRLRFAPARPPSPTRGRRRGAISALQLISNGGDWRGSEAVPPSPRPGGPFSPCGRRCLSAAKADEGCSSLAPRLKAPGSSRPMMPERTDRPKSALQPSPARGGARHGAGEDGRTSARRLRPLPDCQQRGTLPRLPSHGKRRPARA